jgi:hypothetical protein
VRKKGSNYKTGVQNNGDEDESDERPSSQANQVQEECLQNAVGV